MLTLGRPLAITLRSLNSPVLNLYYLTIGRRIGERGAASTVTMSNAATDAPYAAIGDLGGDGQDDLILGESGGDSQQPRDHLEVYRIAAGRPPQLATTLRAFPQSSNVGIRHLLVGDVDPDAPGAEIVVADDGGGGRASARVRILDGTTLDAQRPLGQFRTVRVRRTRDGAFALALGNVLGAEDGKQIVVGDAAGRVSVYSVRHGHAMRENRVAVFPDTPHASAERLAVGNVLSGHRGDEIIVGDDGVRGDAIVRVLDGRDGSAILEFAAFDAAAAGVQVWTGDVISSLPGDELIVGQGAAGGTLRVYSLATGAPVHLFDISDTLPRRSSLRQDLAIGDLLPELPGDEIAVAQPDPQMPVQIFHLRETEAVLTNEIEPSDVNGVSNVGSVTIGR